MMAEADLDDPTDQRRTEVAKLETMIEDAQHKYEATIRQHLQAMHKGGVDVDDKQFPQLYANVRRWQDQLGPVLKEQEARPEFDIHKYGNKLLGKLTDLKTKAPDTEAVPFARLVHGQPRYEVCRRFLTCLMLTNAGNTDIMYKSEDERLNKFGIRLLTAENEMISLGSEVGAEGAKTGHGRAKKAKLAVIDAEEDKENAMPPPRRVGKRLRTLQA